LPLPGAVRLAAPAHDLGNPDAARTPERGAETFNVVSGPSTRRIVDFSQVEKSWAVSPLGNSGNLFSGHDRDQSQMFLRGGEYRLQLMDESDIQAASEATLILRPSPPL
jgi:acyl-homoserine lactone acylase PvdQ